ALLRHIMPVRIATAPALSAATPQLPTAWMISSRHAIAGPLAMAPGVPPVPLAPRSPIRAAEASWQSDASAKPAPSVPPAPSCPLCSAEASRHQGALSSSRELGSRDIGPWPGPPTRRSDISFSSPGIEARSAEKLGQARAPVAAQLRVACALRQEPAGALPTEQPSRTTHRGVRECAWGERTQQP